MRTPLAWVGRLTEWYHSSRREMPWRREPTPYWVWISEIMLQQTQVETVIPYFRRFIRRFPNVRRLAAADLQEVLRSWEGLGYYARARNLHRAARLVVAESGGKLPASYEALRKLPGLGPYTAAAVASIAYGEPVPAVDGNVLRVLARFWGIDADIRQAATRLLVSERLKPIIQTTDPETFNQALMELGALVCRPRHPDCPACPLRRSCVARRENRTKQLPRRSARARVPHHEIAVGIIWRGSKILVARRPEDRMLGGLWEFPGGKRREGETLEETARREIFEETGLPVRVGHRYAVVRHAYTHFRITLVAFRCDPLPGRARALASEALRWCSPGELDALPFPAANRKVLTAIRQHHARPS